MATTAPSEPNLQHNHARAFRKNLLAWHKDIERNMPWKGSSDPYFIWISEIILQQTRVEQGIPYFERFIETFPTLGALANASETEVLSVWKGLGYYTRARNMLKAARIIRDDYDGKLPADYKKLIALPGIGPYTASAIASFAFSMPRPVVDGNVTRVLARYFDDPVLTDSGPGRKRINELADSCMDVENPAAYNQAIMDFGALVCTPANPPCETCVQNNLCRAYRAKTVSMRPVKAKKTVRRQRYFYYFLVRRRGEVALKRRDGKDIWKGLYELPMIETPAPVDDAESLARLAKKCNLELVSENPLFERQHVLSHQMLNAVFHAARLLGEQENWKWCEEGLLWDLPVPRLIEEFLELQFNNRQEAGS